PKMDRRTLLALVLTAIVIVVTPMLFPPSRAPRPTAKDTQQLGRSADRPESTTALVSPAPVPRGGTTVLALPAVRAETTIVRTNRATYYFVSPGATPTTVVLPEYKSLRPGSRQSVVSLVDQNDRLLRLRLIAGSDTIVLDTVAFRAGQQRREGNVVVQPFSSSGVSPITLTYRLPADSFVAHLEGRITGAASVKPGQLLVTLPSRVRTDEADTVDDTRHLAISYKLSNKESESAAFKQVDQNVTRVDTGVIRWVAERNKYFVVAAIPEGRD